MREEYSIRYKSELMSQKSTSNEIYSKPLHKCWKSTGFEDVTASTPEPSGNAKKTYPDSVACQGKKSAFSERNQNIY